MGVPERVTVHRKIDLGVFDGPLATLVTMVREGNQQLTLDQDTVRIEP